MAATDLRSRTRRAIAGGRPFDVLFAVACVGVWLGLVILASALTFNGDEWDILKRADDWSFEALNRPHNEHWSLAFRLVYQSLFALFGMSMYLPYIAVALTFHVLTAVALYVYARRQTAAVIALAIGVVFLLLGSGGANLFWAMQIGFNGATVAGTWALVMLLREPRPRHAALASVLLLVSITFAGIGLFFTASALAAMVLTPRLRRWWWVPLPGIVSWVLWYLSTGGGRSNALSTVRELSEFVRVGISNTIGQVSGLGQEIGLVLAVLLAIAVIASLVGRRGPSAGLIAGAVGLISQFVVTGLVRAAGGAFLATAPRYVHPGAAFLFIAMIGWLGGNRYVRRADHHLGLVAVVVGLTFVALSWNLHVLRVQHDHFQAQADETRAAIALMTEYGGSPAFPSEAAVGPMRDGSGRLTFSGDGVYPLIPGPARLATLIDGHGSPVDDPIAVRLRPVQDALVDEVFARLAGRTMAVTPGPVPPGVVPPTITGQRDVTLATGDGCTAVTATAAEPSVDLAATPGMRLYLDPEQSGGGDVTIAVRDTYAGEALPFETDAGQPLRIDIPDIGPDAAIGVRIGLPAGTTYLCQIVGGVDATLPAAITDLRLQSATNEAAAVVAPDLLATHSVVLSDREDGCLVVAAIGPDPLVSMRVPDGMAVRVSATEGGPAQVFVDVGAGYSEADSQRFQMTTAPSDIWMPPGSQQDGYRIRVDPPDGQTAVVCVVRIGG